MKRLWLPRITWNRKPQTQIIDSAKKYKRQKVVRKDRENFSKDINLRSIKLWLDTDSIPPTGYRVIETCKELEHIISMHRAGNIDISEITIGDRMGIFNVEDIVWKIAALYGSPNGVRCPTINLTCSVSTGKFVQHLKNVANAKVRTQKVTGKLD